MFFLDAGDGRPWSGASPERLVRLEDGRVEMRPIAGTRPRGATPTEDDALAPELLADPKERAEHVMLVDLGRNDVGRVARYGSGAGERAHGRSSATPTSCTSSRTSQGELGAGPRRLDVLRAVFPAGTVSGAPKVRAMEIIDELEPVRARAPTRGCVGYFGFDGIAGHGDHDPHRRSCTGRHGLRAGGRRASSPTRCPEREHEECVAKARALMAAIERAGATGGRP